MDKVTDIHRALPENKGITLCHDSNQALTSSQHYCALSLFGKSHQGKKKKSIYPISQTRNLIIHPMNYFPSLRISIANINPKMTIIFLFTQKIKDDYKFCFSSRSVTRKGMKILYINHLYLR